MTIYSGMVRETKVEVRSFAGWKQGKGAVTYQVFENGRLSKTTRDAQAVTTFIAICEQNEGKPRYIALGEDRR